jgi:flagellar biosynthesis/type III secretory pathway protein FliH
MGLIKRSHLTAAPNSEGASGSQGIPMAEPFVSPPMTGQGHAQAGSGALAPEDDFPDLDAILGLSPSATPEPSAPVEPQFLWTVQTIEQGLAPERRTKTNTPERRHGYRRKDDRDLVFTAHQEAELIAKQAFQQGYQAGLEHAEAELQQIYQTLSQLQGLQQWALQQAAQEVVPLAIKIAERILHVEVSMDPGLIQQLVTKLLDQVDIKQKQVTLKAHPEDVASLREEAQSNPNWTLNDRQIVVLEDRTVQQGSVILETPAGQVDARFSTQLDLVRKLFSLSKPLEADAPPEEPQLPTDAQILQPEYLREGSMTSHGEG